MFLSRHRLILLTITQRFSRWSLAFTLPFNELICNIND
ncbi:hypothetical protein B194_1728 [Serratia plymuthica A30]|nr:hypothetical protein B194_1728 [Serratia plymuthica A30]